jgi:hypothetical protein
MGGGESFADDLNSGQGTVSSRVALLLRSAEVKPLFQRFVQQTVELLSSYQGGSLGQVQFDLAIWAAFQVSDVCNL